MKLDEINFSDLSHDELQAFLRDLKKYVECRETADLLSDDLNAFIFERFEKDTLPDSSVGNVQGPCSQEDHSSQGSEETSSPVSLKEEGNICRSARNWRSRPKRSFEKEGKKGKREKNYSHAKSSRDAKLRENPKYRLSPPTLRDVCDAIKYLQCHPELDTDDYVDDLEGEIKKGSTNWNAVTVGTILSKIEEMSQSGSGVDFEYKVDSCGCVTPLFH